ncbi:translation initiation factor eIF3 core subunit B [Martiniozyma asiatica (nom. inval.)]|nr:translation initiation factor eIF3 core subunit B [Martiniozyma asiatica]
MSFDPSTVDFSDLEEKYTVPEPVPSVDNYVLVDGAPIAPESKAPVLKKVLSKLFSQCGKVVDIILPLEAGKTKGYLIIEFSHSAEALKAIKTLNGKKLDVKHRLLVNKLSDVHKYVTSGQVTEEFQEPEVPEFKNVGYLNNWLLDSQARDQFFVHTNKDACVYWFKKNISKEEAIAPREKWTLDDLKWSPKGKYLFSNFPNGVQSWGGDNFDRINRYFHPNIQRFDFSPNEKYLITYSSDPIVDPEILSEEKKKDYPFSAEDAGKKLVIWDIVTGWPVKTFAVPPAMEESGEWPLVKWSFDETYCARRGPDAIAVYETGNNFELLDKKLLKIDGIQDFEFSPAGARLPDSRKGDPLSTLIAYWTPESNNQSAKVSIMSLPNKKILRTAPLVQVADCKLYWQKEGKYFCVRVNRHTKSKKTMFSNLEIFQVVERDVPVEKIELQDIVLDFAWEPKGNKFAFISKKDKNDASNNQLGSSNQNKVTFYGVDDASVSGNNGSKKWIQSAVFQGNDLKTLDCNTVSWCPTGRFCVLATIGKQQSSLDFYDTDFDGIITKASKDKTPTKEVKHLSTMEFAGLHELNWETSGRYVTAISSCVKSPVNNGFTVYTMVGHVVREEPTDQMISFQWRPRPTSLLSANDKKRVRKNLKEYSVQFEEIDNMEANNELKELILKRKAMLKEWNEWTEQVYKKLNADGYATKEKSVELVTVEDIKEVVIEEKEEVVESA